MTARCYDKMSTHRTRHLKTKLWRSMELERHTLHIALYICKETIYKIWRSNSFERFQYLVIIQIIYHHVGWRFMVSFYRNGKSQAQNSQMCFYDM